MITPKSLLSFLSEAAQSEAAQKAKEMGLTSAGYGNWRDKTGNVVAKTENGQLVMIEPGEQSGQQSGAPEAEVEQPEAPQIQEPDPAMVEKIAKGLSGGRYNIASAQRKKELLASARQTLINKQIQDNQMQADADAQAAAQNPPEPTPEELAQQQADMELQQQNAVMDTELKAQSVENGKLDLQMKKDQMKQQKEADKEAKAMDKLAKKAQAEQEAQQQAEVETQQQADMEAQQQADMEAQQAPSTPRKRKPKKKVTEFGGNKVNRNEDEPTDEEMDGILKLIRSEGPSTAGDTMTAATKAAKVQNEIDNTDYEMDDIESDIASGDFENEIDSLYQKLGELTDRQKKNVDKKFGKVRKSLSKMTDQASRANMKQALALASTYTGRVNSGAGKNALGIVDYQVLKSNTPRLVAGYGSGTPEEVKKFVESTRVYNVSDEEVDAFYEMLPQKLKNGFNKAGTIAPSYRGHYLGQDENGEAIRGTLSASTSQRGKIVARLLLQQGLRDAYTGLPLDLNQVDLEHVVGFNNNDYGKATQNEFNERENINNFVLTASNVNQLKADKNMQDFITTEVDKLDSFTEQDFDARDDLTNRSNDINTAGATLSALFLNEGQKPGGDLAKMISPQASFENFDSYAEKDRGLTKDINSQINKFAKGKGINLANVKNRMGYETMKKLGLGSYIPKAPTLDDQGRVVKEGRGNQSKFDDKIYVAFLSSVIAKDDAGRTAGREAWDGARQAAVEAMNASGNNGDGKRALISSLMESGYIDQRFLESKDFRRILKEECGWSYSLYLAEQRIG